MSVTAVPLQPIAKGALRTLWVGLAAVALAAGGYAAWSTADIRSQYQSNADWFADNGKEDGVVTTKSGLQYRITREGEGATPKKGQVMLISYAGKLRDGTEFDSAPQAPMLVGEGQTIPGFDEGLMLLKKGSKADLWIPSELAYGEKEMPNPQTGEIVIPANSLLHFEIEVLDIMDRAAFEAQMEAQQKQMQQMQEQMGGAGAPPPQGQPQAQ